MSQKYPELEFKRRITIGERQQAAGSKAEGD
jgi:hypothetical protein